MTARTRLAPPPTRVPIPAAHWAGDLADRWVWVGAAGQAGWWTGRAIGPAHTDPKTGATTVPVATHEAWWRHRLLADRLPVVDCSLDLLWAEHYLTPPADSPPPSSAADWRELADLGRITTDWDAPPPTPPTPGADAGPLLGRTVVRAVTRVGALVWQSTERATSEPVMTGDGPMVRLASEDDWWRWRLAGATPTAVTVPLDQLWVY